MASARDTDSRCYKNLRTVEVGLLVVCLCQRFDRHYPTLNTSQPDCLCSCLLCSLTVSTVQQPACLCLHHLSPYPKCYTSTPISTCKRIRELYLVRPSLVSMQVVRVLRFRCNTTQCGFDSSLYRSNLFPISFISLQSFFPPQDKLKQLNLCILKTNNNLSLPIFPAIRGNHYVIDIDQYSFPPPSHLFFVDDG